MTIYSFCPVIPEQSKFARVIDISGGAGIQGKVEFDFELLWLKESETETRLLSSARKVLKTGSRYNDYYGYLTSIISPLEEVSRFVSEWDVEQGGPLTVEIVTTITEKPVYRNPTPHKFETKPTYLPIPDDWVYANDPAIPLLLAATDMVERMEHTIALKRITEKTISERVIWSSKHGDDRNGKLLLDMMEEAVVGIPEDLATKIRTQMLARITQPA